MANDLLSQSLDPSSPPSTALLPSNPAEQYGGEWNGVPAWRSRPPRRDRS